MQAFEFELLLAKVGLGKGVNRETSNTEAIYRHNPIQEEYKPLLISYLSKLLGLKDLNDAAIYSEIRLRTALHLSCPEAVAYDHSRPEPRWVIISRFIEDNFPFTKSESETLARLASSVLDDWDVNRVSSKVGKRNMLLDRQGYRCACCKLDFKNKTRVEEEELRALGGYGDPYKPYFDGDSVTAYMSPVVDHIFAVSREGTNRSDNLQILCRLCNEGKSDGSGIPSSRELNYSHLPLELVPRSHFISDFYYRLFMDEFKCSVCDSNSEELTMRLDRPTGLFILTNLRTVCHQCSNR